MRTLVYGEKMKKEKLTILIACLLVVCLTISLCACHKKGIDEKAKRQQAANDVGAAFTTGVNSSWAWDMSDEAAAGVQNPGDYVMTRSWTALICQVLEKSSLQTGKITALANALQSKDGKALLADFTANAELLIPLLKQVGFTPNDVANLTYDLLCALVSDGAKTLSDMRDRLVSVREEMRKDLTTTDSALKNVADAIVSTDVAIQNFAPTEQEKQDMISAFEQAKQPMNMLISFAYNMSINAITDDLYSKLFDGSGALGSISESELQTLVNSLLSNVTSLSNSLDEQSVAKLNVALGLVIDKFDSNAISSSVYAQIVKYAKYAYMVVDVIPSVCDVLIAGGDVLANESFLEDFIAVAKSSATLDEKTCTVNKAILAARAANGVLGGDSFTKEQLVAVIEKMGAQGIQEYQKATPIFALDLALNFSSLIESIEGDDAGKWNVSHKDVMDEDTLATVASTVLFFNKGFDTFKETYRKYTKGEATTSQLAMQASICGFDSFLSEWQSNNYNVNTQTEQWYNYYVTTGLEAVNRKVASCMEKVENDLKAFVEDYYAENSDMKAAIKQLADMSIVSQNLTEEEINGTYMPIFKRSCMLGFTFLFLF